MQENLENVIYCRETKNEKDAETDETNVNSSKFSRKLLLLTVSENIYGQDFNFCSFLKQL